MAEINNKTYIINGLSYTKEQIFSDEKLNKKYLEIIKYEMHKEKVKNRMRELRKENPEKYREATRIRMAEKYKNDLDYRTKKLEKARNKRKEIAELLNLVVKPRGRQPMYKLNEDLECIRLC